MGLDEKCPTSIGPPPLCSASPAFWPASGSFRSVFLLGAGLMKEAFLATGAANATAIDGSGFHTGLLLAATASAFLGALFGNRLLRKGDDARDWDRDGANAVRHHRWSRHRAGLRRDSARRKGDDRHPEQLDCAPRRSHRPGCSPSISQSQNSAVTTETPPRRRGFAAAARWSVRNHANAVRLRPEGSSSHAELSPEPEAGEMAPENSQRTR